MTVIYYESSDSDFEGFQDYDETQEIKSSKPELNLITKKLNDSSNSHSYNSTSKRSLLPAPKKKLYAPPPPEPIKVIQPVVAEAKKEMLEDEEVIVVDANDLQEKNAKLAQDNAMVKDKTLYRGVGRQREKSQLTYLSEVFAQDAGNFQKLSRRATHTRINAAQMYGW